MCNDDFNIEEINRFNAQTDCELTLTDGISITSKHTVEDREFVCESLVRHNIKNTAGLLKKPGIDINLYLKRGDKVLGAILCDTFNMSLYIDVLWIDEACRGYGYGKILMNQAEKMARDNGCVLAHTCTFSYQSPAFYKACGYEVFGQLDDYPDGIVQYFLKKKL